MSNNYDLVILGGGMGGYVAAIRARQLGMTVAIVEKDFIGGTCLHKGCIPTKSLLKSASVFQSIVNSQKFGIETSHPVLHYSEVLARKDKIINQLYQGLQTLMRRNQIEIINGYGRLLGPSIFSPMSGTISVQYDDGRDHTVLVGKHVLLATGTRARTLNVLPIDGDYILTSDDILALNELPKSIVIIGGGVIGVEFASLFHDFGVDVTIIEAESKLLPSFDQDLSIQLMKELKQKGVKILTSTKIVNQQINHKQLVDLEIVSNEGTLSISTEKVLVAIGRSANTDDIGLDNTSIQTNDAGFITVNQYYQTKEDHIYAVGDCIGGAQLAHVAAHEGKLAVEHMASVLEKFQHTTFTPSCVYSQPEVATVGLTEQQAKQQNINYKIKKLSFKSIGKALINGHSDGFIKMIINEETNDIIGIHLIGQDVTELIAEASLAMLLDATASEIGLNIHPHPSLSEAIQEVALAMENQPVHTI